MISSSGWVQSNLTSLQDKADPNKLVEAKPALHLPIALVDNSRSMERWANRILASE